MQERKRQFEKINEVFLPAISRPLVIFGIGLLFIQLLWIPALAQGIEYYDGYNVITYDNGSRDIISGALNFLQWDGTWRSNDELNISNGSWPYLYSENATTADFRVDDDTLSIPKANTKFIMKENSISQVLEFPKSELHGKETPINLTDAFIDFPYFLKSKKSKNKYEDKYNINYGRFNFKAGKDQITIHDNTLREYIEDGKVFQDYTYLFEDDYDFIIEKGEIRLEFKKKALDKLMGNIIIEIHTWHVNGPNNWGGNDVAFSQTIDVKATGNVELRQEVDDYKLYARFDEGNGTTIHNENTGNVLMGNLEGNLTSDTWVTNGKYGKAIYFNGIDTFDGNRVLFNNHPDIRLPGNFVISIFLYHTGYENPDTDIIRKGSTSTATAWNKIEVGADINPNTIFAFIEDNSSKVQLNDTTPDRRDGNWHFIALTREETTCNLMVDGVAVATKNCSSNTSNTAQLSIGAKDSSFPDDFIEGLIDDVRIYDRILTPKELEFIENNEHFTTGTVTRNLTSIIQAGEELRELGCNGTWDMSITKVDIMASTNNVNWDKIQPNATPNAIYSIDTGKNYTYLRCSLSTTDSSHTPIIESIRARIIPKGTFYTISVSTSPSYLSPQPNGGDEYTPGQIATVTAQPVYGYTFRNWTENASQVSTDPAYQFTVTRDRNLVAEYAQNPEYTISLSTSPSGLSPSPAGAGQYLSGQNATVVAQLVNDYTFQKWTENGILLSIIPAYQFTVTGDRNLVAEYTHNTGSLVGWWKFDNDILDWSGNRNDGACSGSGCPTPTTGKVAGALYFDGINDYIDAGNGARLNITGNITIETWVKPAKLGTQYIVKKASNGVTNGYELSLASSSSRKAFFRFNQKASANTYRVETVIDYPYNNNTWIYLVGTYNGSQLQIFLNGHLSNSKSGSSSISSNTNNLTIGGPDDSAFYKGAIDEVRIWNRALTPQEIEAFYNGQNPVYTISVSTSPSDLNPSPTGAGQYPFGQKATVTAQPVYGYIFRNWTDGGKQVSTSPAYQFMVTEDRNLAAIFTPNRPPVSEAGGPYTVNEGSPVTVDASSSSDPDRDALTYAWDLDNDGTYETSGVAATITPPDGNATITVGLQVSDGNGGISTDTATVTVINVDPTVGPITAPIDPLSVGTEVAASATFTDPGTVDTHTALWNWGDGTTTQGTVTDKSVAGSHIYTTAGIYTVTLTVTDDDGGAGSATYMYIVIYDPTGGFVTGGGWINSPVGAYMADPNLTGHANFNVNSKYQKGEQVPTGVTEFQFEVADLNFHSTAYEWLVVAGTRAQYEGTGTINGQDEYGFMLTAIDGTPDGMRIKIWNKANEEVVYDNKNGSSDTGNDTTELGGGSIVIHTK